MNRVKWTTSLALCLSFLIAYTSSSYADTLPDPATLQIGPGTTIDPTQIGTSGEVTVTNNQGGAGDLNTPWLLIIGIVNSTTDNATITSINGTTLGTPISNNGVTATMVTGQEAYSQLGITGADNSNSFTNWAGAELSVNGITATSFGLFEYDIPVTLSAKGTDTFQLSGLPAGSFVIAEGDDSKLMYDTPFTRAGLTGLSVPEPSSAILLGMGMCMFVVGLVTWKRRPSSETEPTKG